MAGHDDDGASQVAFTRPLLEQRDAVGIRHPDVQQYQVRIFAFVRDARRLGIGRGMNLVTLFGEYFLNQ